MTVAYLIQRFPEHRNGWFDTHISEIKRINPDKIIVLSMGEINVEYIFDELFDGIQDWLIENNKYLYVVWAGPDKEIRPHILGASSLGSSYGNVSCVNALAMQFPDDSNLLDTADKLFTAYNNNPKYERKVLVDLLVKYDLIKEGIVTYRFPGHDTNPSYKWRHHDGSVLYDEPDYAISSKPEYSPAFLPKSYMNGFIDIVTETDCQEGYFVATEKNAKPWGAMKPYLVLSSKDYHSWLREEYGIEPYTEMFDYSFDSLPNVEDRIKGILKNLAKLRIKFNRAPDSKRQMYEQIKPKLIHNRNMALNIIDRLQANDKIIPDCLRFITTESDYQIVGEATSNTGGIHFITNRQWLLKPVLDWRE